MAECHHVVAVYNPVEGWWSSSGLSTVWINDMSQYTLPECDAVRGVAGGWWLDDAFFTGDGCGVKMIGVFVLVVVVV